MVRISVLNDALKNMFNAEKRGKRQVLIRPSSKVVIKFLSVMQKHGENVFPLKKTLVSRCGFLSVFLHISVTISMRCNELGTDVRTLDDSSLRTVSYFLHQAMENNS